MTVSTPTFKSFLGLDLRTGCFIIGYIQLVFLILITIAAFALHAGLGNWLATLGNLQAAKYIPGIIESIVVCRKLFGVAIGSLILMDCFTLILLVGLHVNSRVMVKIFLVYMGVSLVLSVMMAFPIAVGLLTAASVGAAFLHIYLPTIINIVVAGVTCGLPQVYFFMLLTSHYHHMGGQRSAPQAHEV